MKKYLTSLLVVLITLNTIAQNDNSSLSSLPEITLKNIDGKDVKLSDYGANQKITVISFWATWCKPCIK